MTEQVNLPGARRWRLGERVVIGGEIVSTSAYGDIRVLNVVRERGGVVVGEVIDPRARVRMGKRVSVLVSVCRPPAVFAGDLIVRGSSTMEWVVYSCDAEGKMGRCFRPGQPARYPTKSFGAIDDPVLHLLDYALLRWMCLDCGIATRNRTGLCPQCRKVASSVGVEVGDRVRGLLEKDVSE